MRIYWTLPKLWQAIAMTLKLAWRESPAGGRISLGTAWSVGHIYYLEDPQGPRRTDIARTVAYINGRRNGINEAIEKGLSGAELRTLFLVFDMGGDEPEFQGVFSTEGAAIEACRTDTHCICPATLNEELAQEPSEWQGAWFPHLETQP